MAPTSLMVRRMLAGLSALSLVMVGVRVLSYRHLLALPGARGTVIWTVALLTVYLVLPLWPKRLRNVRLRPSIATFLGAAGGALQIAHMLVERFAQTSGRWNGAASPLIELGTFCLWGYVAFQLRRHGIAASESAAGAMWSAVVTMTLAVAAGVLMELFLAPYPLELMRSWPEFQRTSWDDLQAFRIDNTLDAARSHLLLGPIVAAIFGGLGIALMRAVDRVRSSS